MKREEKLIWYGLFFWGKTILTGARWRKKTPYYLIHVYEIGPDTGTYDYVGPFDSAQDAEIHRRTYGPVRSTVTRLKSPSPVMSAMEHATYVTARD